MVDFFEGSYQEVCRQMNYNESDQDTTIVLREKIKKARDAGNQAEIEFAEQQILGQANYALIKSFIKAYRQWIMEECKVRITRSKIANPLNLDYIDAAWIRGYMIEIEAPPQESKTRQIIIPM